ncbi:hypothetical protein ACHAXR_012845 [Thalassiosira sp. AJA248-18]
MNVRLSFNLWDKENENNRNNICSPSGVEFYLTKKPSQCINFYSSTKSLRTNAGKNTKKSQKNSATGNRTPVSRVTGGDTSHYTIADFISWWRLRRTNIYNLFYHDTDGSAWNRGRSCHRQ